MLQNKQILIEFGHVNSTLNHKNRKNQKLAWLSKSLNEKQKKEQWTN